MSMLWYVSFSIPCHSLAPFCSFVAHSLSYFYLLISPSHFAFSLCLLTLPTHLGVPWYFVKCLIYHRNTDTSATCLLHPSLRIQGPVSLVFYFIAIFALAVLYEYFKAYNARRDALFLSNNNGTGFIRSRRSSDSSSSLLSTSNNSTNTPPRREALRIRIHRAMLYTLSVTIAVSFSDIIISHSFLCELTPFPSLHIQHPLVCAHAPGHDNECVCCCCRAQWHLCWSCSLWPSFSGTKPSVPLIPLRH